MLKTRRYTQADASSGNQLHRKVSASRSRSLIESSQEIPKDQINEESSYQDVGEVKSENEKDDRRPSFEEMHAEDFVRRPSVTDYQTEDPDHPDIRSIQSLVARMTFGL